MNDDLLDLISIDPAICQGQPCIKGTRIMVTIVLDALAAGLDTAEILRHYPTLTSDSVRAAAAYPTAPGWPSRRSAPSRPPREESSLSSKTSPRTTTSTT